MRATEAIFDSVAKQHPDLIEDAMDCWRNRIRPRSSMLERPIASSAPAMRLGQTKAPLHDKNIIYFA